jgi:hypothetical protein
LKCLLSVLCGLLIVTITAELSYGTDHDNEIRTATTEAAHTASHVTTGDAGAASSLAQSVATILRRPLFAPDRKSTAATTAGDVGLPRLTGVIASPDVAVAIFQAAGNEKPVLLRHGDMVAGWQVTTIASNAVGLRKADDRLILRPAFDNSKAGNATREVSQSRSRWEAAAPAGLLRARWSNPQLQP